jgi:hypothetical protein
MSRGKRGRKKRNRGWFRKGADPRRSSYRPTREECRRGYANALAKLSNGDVNVYAWFWRRIRSFFRAKGTWYAQLMKGKSDGEEQERHSGAAAGGDPASGGDDPPY